MDISAGDWTGPGFWPRALLAALATWRLTHLLALEDGPFDLVLRLRRSLGPAGAVLDCFYCLSLWVAAPLALVIARDPAGWCGAWVALSGAACLAQRATQPPIVIDEMKGAGDGLLRTEALRDEPAGGAGDAAGGAAGGKRDAGGAAGGTRDDWGGDGAGDRGTDPAGHAAR